MSKFPGTKLMIACAVIGMGAATYMRAETMPDEARRYHSALAGSWLMTYNVPAFVIPIPVLLSFTDDGVIIETDSPAPTPFGGSIGTLILSNGQGSWKPKGNGKFAYTYRKILYDANGLPFGLARTNGAVTSSSPSEISVDLDIQFTDNNGNVVFSATGSATGNRIPVEN